MKKRSLALILALLLAASSLLTACGNGGEGGSNKPGKEEDYSAYEYGDIDYAADVTGIDMSLVEKPMSEIDRATLEYAIQQVCLAYYYKGENTQYDLGRQSYDQKRDSYRRTTGQSPEDSEWDSNWYSQCAEYCYDVYYELCGYEYINCGTIRSTREDFKKEQTSIPYGSGTMGWNEDTVTQLILYDARPGDIFHSNGSTGGGHLIMILGDIDGDGENDCCHCWPYKGGTMRLPVDEDDSSGTFVSGKAADQKWDECGVVFQSARSLIINKKGTNGMPSWGVFNTCSDKNWWIYRPFEQSDIGNYHLSTDTVTRMTYEGIEVSKVPQCSIHQSIVKDEDVVITETIENHGKKDFTGLQITEYVPNGAVFKSADNDGKNDGRKIQWTVDVPAGGTVTLSYTVTNKYGANKELVIPAGLAAGLQTRTFTLQVANSTFTEEQMAAINDIATKKALPADSTVKAAKELEFITAFYKEVIGKEIELPLTVNELMAGIVEEKKAIKGCSVDKMLFRKEDITGYEKLNQMVIRNQIGGYFYSTGEYPGVENYTIKRMLDTKEGYWMPGDVFIAFDGNSKRALESPGDLKIYIYLGNNTVVGRIGGGSGFTTYDSSIDQLLSMNFFVALRPNLVY